MKEKIKFIDLFSGIGGFHQALMQIDNISEECVFASEIDKYAIDTYMNNYGIDSGTDITTVRGDEDFLSDYNMMCAGFPCQAFSKAGKQEGFDDPTKGTLFFDIKRLLEYRVNIGKPVKYIILENVANLVTHDNKNTWKVIQKTLKDLGYITTKEPLIVSPHQVGVPQSRPRVFILGIHKEYTNLSCIPEPKFEHKRTKRNVTSMDSITFDSKNVEEFKLSAQENLVIDAWSEFKKNVIGNKAVGFPIWYDYFKYEEVDFDELPMWKQQFISKNKILYKKNKDFIDKWSKKYKVETFTPTQRKFEWQAGSDIDNVDDGIMQFRPSGLRVKRPTEFPALVAMVHIPIVNVKGVRRRLTPNEVKKLQSFPDSFKLCNNDQQAYKQFGNSVNVDVVKRLVKHLIEI